MVDTVRTQQELLDRMKINVAGVQVGRRADINVQTFRDFVISIPTLGAPGLSNIVEDLTPQLGGVLDQNGFDIKASDPRGPCIQDADSLLNAVINPNKADLDTGVGWRAANQFDLIAGTVSKMTLGTAIIRMRDNVTFQAAGGTQIQNENATTINPVFLPHGSDPDTGLGGVLNTSLNAIVNGSSKMQWGTSESIFAQLLRAAASGGPSIQNETASTTNPVFSPNNSLLTAGMGGDASGNVSMITDALERMRFSDAGLITFFQDLRAQATPGALIKAGLVSSTNPSIAPSHLDPDTGLGICGANCLAFIAGGINVMQMTTGELIVTPAAFTIRGSDAAGPAFRNVAASNTVPTLIPRRDELTTGIGAAGANLQLITDAISRMTITAANITFTPASFGPAGANRPSMRNEASSLINPTLLPDISFSSSGIGGTSGSVALIAGAANRINVDSTGIGFFAITPAAQPTGVAVTAAAIHAALVTLGLITA